MKPSSQAWCLQINIDDLRRASNDLDGKASERELEAVIDAFDRSLDGAVSQEEFMVSRARAPFGKTKPRCLPTTLSHAVR